jgi:hypothetical protein
VDNNSRSIQRIPSNAAIGSSRPPHKLAGVSSVTVNSNPHQHANELSRRSSPQEILEGLSTTPSGIPRSVPITPLTSRNLDIGPMHKGARASGLPSSGGYVAFGGETYKSSPGDLSDSLGRIGQTLDTPLTFNSIRSGDDVQVNTMVYFFVVHIQIALVWFLR